MTEIIKSINFYMMLKQAEMVSKTLTISSIAQQPEIK